MADFLDSVKKGVSAAVSRTSWEAQKQMRVRSKQTEVDKLLEQREKLLNDLAQTAIDLYQKGALTDSHLTRLCASIQELDHDVQNREMQLSEIKKEAFPAQQLGPAPTSDYTPPAPAPTYTPPAYTPPAPAAPTYTPPAPVAPPSAPKAPVAASSANQPQAQSSICPSCGNPLRPNALYCRNCGAKLR
ncbi:MAG TPA: zinc ribbon domain-containing protein [Ktedonobacteraceae bacterium]|jgi:ribosomal protein L40E